MKICNGELQYKICKGELQFAPTGYSFKALRSNTLSFN